MKIFKNFRIIGIASLLSTGAIMGAITAPCSVAQGAASAGATAFGSVNIAKITAGYTKKEALDSQIRDLNERLSARIKVQADSGMLSRDQQQRYSTLLALAAPTDKDRAEITALKASSAQDAQELAALQQKQNPSDAEKARLGILTAAQQTGRQALSEVNDQYTEQLKSVAEKISTQFNDTVRAAVAAVAHEKGLALVFTSDVAIYSANDITDDVLKHLNK